MEHDRTQGYYPAQPAYLPEVRDVAFGGRMEIQEQEPSNQAGSQAGSVEATENVMTTPLQKESSFKVLRELPIEGPIDRVEYRQWRINQALSRLATAWPDATEDLRQAVIDSVNARIDMDQGISRPTP